MDKADCFHLGNIAKLHGFKGEVSLFLDVTNPGDYETLDALFIDINGYLTPFFVKSLRFTNKGFAIVKFEGVDDENSARRILRKEVYLPAEILPELEGNEFYDHEVVGFKVIDEKHGDIGVVENIIDLKVNPLIQVNKDGLEILIPLIEGAIVKLDRKKKELHVATPDGLVELYLG